MTTISTPFQQKWLSKLLEFDFEIRYKTGASNRVADALSRVPAKLSRVPAATLLAIHLSMVGSDMWQQVCDSWKEDTGLQQIIRGKEHDPSSHPHYSWKNQQLRRNGKLVVGVKGDLRTRLIAWHHSSAQGGHSGITPTLKRLSRLFYWSGMRTTVTDSIRNYLVCERCKSNNAAYQGLL